MELRNIHNKNNLFHQWTQLSFGNRPLAPKALPQDSFKKSEEDDDTSSKNKKRFATPYSPKSRTRHSPASSVPGTTTAAGNVSIPALFGIATFATVVIGGAVLINKRLQSLQASRLQPEKSVRFKTLTASHFEASTTESLLQTESTPKSSKTANDGNSLLSKSFKYIQTLFTKSGTSTASAKTSAQSGNSIPPTPKSSKTANDGNSLWSKRWDAIQTLFTKSGKSTSTAKKPTKTSKSSPPKKTTAKPGSTAPYKLSKMGKAIGSWGKGIWKQVTNPATWPALGRPTGGSGSSAPSTSAPTVGSGSSAASTSAPPGGTIREWFRRLFRLGAGSSAPPHPTPPGAKISSGSTTPVESSISGDDVSGLWFADESVGDDLSCSAFSVGSPTSVDDETESIGDLLKELDGEILSEPSSPVMYPPSWVDKKKALLNNARALQNQLTTLLVSYGIVVPQDLKDDINSFISSLSALNPTEKSDETDITHKLNGYQTTFDELQVRVDSFYPSSSPSLSLEEEFDSTDPLVQPVFGDFSEPPVVVRGVGSRARTDSCDSEVGSVLPDDQAERAHLLEEWGAFTASLSHDCEIMPADAERLSGLVKAAQIEVDSCTTRNALQEAVEKHKQEIQAVVARSKSQLQQLTHESESLKQQYQAHINYVEDNPLITYHFNLPSYAATYKRFVTQLVSAFDTVARVDSYEEGMRLIDSLSEQLTAFSEFITTGYTKLKKELDAYDAWKSTLLVPSSLIAGIQQKVDEFDKQLKAGKVTHEDITRFKAEIDKQINDRGPGVTPN